jgi:hypothetical protein
MNKKGNVNDFSTIYPLFERFCSWMGGGIEAGFTSSPG